MATRTKLPPKTANAKGGRPGKANPRNEARPPAISWLICLMLLVSTLLVYLQSYHHQFISLDDGVYVYENPMVVNGLTAQGIQWAFKSFHSANWHPITWLSHMLDCQMFGSDPGWHHVISVLLHAANVILLYFLLKRMTKAVWRSALVAALFALHPLHVESVAWISERKDVLSGLFFILTLWAYVRFVEFPSRNKYLILLGAFAAGLMAKPMLVTVPFVLLLLDYWPLARIGSHSGRADLGLRTSAWPLVREKLPLFLMSAASSVLTWLAQKKGAAITELADLSLLSRIAASIAAYGDYVRLMVWPSRLGILYPYQAPGIPGWSRLVWVLILAAAIIMVFRYARSRGFLVTGLLWYLGMLVPVIGLLQVGAQAFADRYTYLPYIGLFMMIAWVLGEMADRKPNWHAPVIVAAVALISAFAIRAFFQVQYWRNSITLYERTLVAAPQNPVILSNLGSEYAGEQKLDKAIQYFRQALQYNPNFGPVYAGLGTALARKGQIQEAEKHLNEALRLSPGLFAANHSMGVLLLSQRRFRDAIPFLRNAIGLDGNDADARNAMGAAYLMDGKIDEAITEFQTALKLRPDLVSAQNNLRIAMASRPPPSR